MEVGNNNTAPPPYYGYRKSTFKKFPEILPIGTWSAYEGFGAGINKQVTDRKKVFVVMPSVKAAMIYKAEYILNHGGNFAAWIGDDAEGQAQYRQLVNKQVPNIVNSFHQ